MTEAVIIALIAQFGAVVVVVLPLVINQRRILAGQNQLNGKQDSIKEVQAVAVEQLTNNHDSNLRDDITDIAKSVTRLHERFTHSDERMARIETRIARVEERGRS